MKTSTSEQVPAAPSAGTGSEVVGRPQPAGSVCRAIANLSIHVSTRRRPHCSDLLADGTSANKCPAPGRSRTPGQDAGQDAGQTPRSPSPPHAATTRPMTLPTRTAP
jgi:hypothetical protein